MGMESPPDRNMEKVQVDCPECSGKGYKTQFNDKGQPDGKEDCSKCNGSGKVFRG